VSDQAFIPFSDMTGRIGVQATAGPKQVAAVSSMAPLASSVICESSTELFELLDAEEIDYALIAVGDARLGTVIDSYAAISERDVTIVGEHVDETTETRYLLLAKGRWRQNGRRFRADVRAGDLWLDLPVLSQGRTSIVFALPDEPGALVRALGPISRRHLNVTKLEMQPRLSAPERYMIAAEIDGYAHDPPMKAALDELNRLANDVRVLGAYPTAG
jgi:prephenate dehydratase